MLRNRSPGWYYWYAFACGAACGGLFVGLLVSIVEGLAR